MNAQDRKTLDTFTRAITFADSNPPVLAGAPPGFAKQVQALKAAVAALDRVSPDRGSGRPAKTANQRAVLRYDLRVGKLLPILRVARVLERTVAGMPHLVNLPGRLTSTRSLLDAAKGAARDVAPYKDQFIAKGLPIDFLDQLNAAIQALENAHAANMEARLASANARGQLVQSFQEGRDALTLMDIGVRNMCNANPTIGMPTLTVWNTIVPPRGRPNRSASNTAIGTAVDVDMEETSGSDSGSGSAAATEGAAA